MATMLVPGALRTEVGGASQLCIDAEGTLRAVLDEVTRRWPRLGRRIRDERGELRRYVNVYVNGEDCRMLAGQDTPVTADTEVQVLPSVAGGSVAHSEVEGGSQDAVDGGAHGIVEDGGVAAAATAGVVSGLSPLDGDAILAENFAPWVRELGLMVHETGDDWATLRLPWSDRLARVGLPGAPGGVLCGQALMAAADTATVIAVSAARGKFTPMTTVQQSITFQRPVLGNDVLVAARLTKLGRSLAFAEVTMTAGAAVVAQATTVYALL